LGDEFFGGPSTSSTPQPQLDKSGVCHGRAEAKKPGETGDLLQRPVHEGPQSPASEEADAQPGAEQENSQAGKPF
jgi:hypothetical protein